MFFILLPVCDICGQSVAMFMCGRCDNKQLCTACDERWHQHPKRKNHDRQKLRVLKPRFRVSETKHVFSFTIFFLYTWNHYIKYMMFWVLKLFLQMSSTEQNSDDHEYLSAKESHALIPSPTPQQTHDQLPQEVLQYATQDATQNQPYYSTNEQPPYCIKPIVTPYSAGSNVNQSHYVMSANNNNMDLSTMHHSVQNVPGMEEHHPQEGLISG